MDANQEWIDTIGNDIANVNTTGYKSNEVQFEDLLSQTIAGAAAGTSTQGGIDPTQVGLGVRVAGIESNFTQGTSEQTGNPLDLSVQGDGFFIGKANGQTVYTRAGSLNLDSDGNLETPDGFLVQGWAADAAGAINTSAPVGDLSIPSGESIPATATQNVTLGGNLAQESGWTNPSTTSTATVGASTSVQVYAANGATQSLDLNLEQLSSTTGGPTGTASAWSVEGALTDPGGTPDYTNSTPVTLYFDASGNLLGTSGGTGAGAATATTFALKVPNETTGAATGATATYNLDVAGVTANASDDTLSVLSQDGNAPGILQSYSISTNGVIQGAFSNGETKNLGQIALATFANPDGLERTGDSNFISTAASGLAQVGTPDNGARGSLQAGTLEASNVDLATELTDLIQAQSGFEANGSVITTSNQILQALIQLKQ
jgi:flagellar hook protein FlgE